MKINFYIKDIIKEDWTKTYSLYEWNENKCLASWVKDLKEIFQYKDFLQETNNFISFLSWKNILNKNSLYKQESYKIYDDWISFWSLNWIYYSYLVKDFSDNLKKNWYHKDFYLFTFKKNFLDEIFNTSRLEWSNLTLIETKTILDWISVWWKKLEDIDLIRNLKNWNSLILEKSKWDFEFSKNNFCDLHNEIAKEEALTWWKFRNNKVYIMWLERDVTDHNLLDSIFEDWKEYFDNFEWNIFQKAFLIFLWWSYHQFFFDWNKRTSRWFWNYLLLSNWFYPLTIYYEDQKEYNEVMMKLYETWNADDALKFLEKTYTKNIRKFVE